MIKSATFNRFEDPLLHKLRLRLGLLCSVDQSNCKLRDFFHGLFIKIYKHEAFLSSKQISRSLRKT